MTGQDLLLYDGVCALCNGLVRFLLRHDPANRFLFAPLQGETAREILRRWKEAPDLFDTVYLVRTAGAPGEALLARGRAVVAVLEEVGGVWKAIGRLFAFLPPKVLDLLYDFVARRRYRWFGKYDVCPLPPPEDRGRFLP